MVVQGLNPNRQPPVGIKNTLPKAWRLEGRVTNRTNDNDTVRFFFKSGHHLRMGLYKGQMELQRVDGGKD